MSEWITDRLPTVADTSKEGRWLVWTCYEGQVKQWSYDGITLGQPWKPIVPPEPYVKAKRYKVEEYYHSRGIWVVRECKSGEGLMYSGRREDAERIAAIYEEVMP